MMGFVRSRRPTGPPSAVVDRVLERAQYSCEVCGDGVGDIRGVDWSVHHRRPRQMGGTRAPWINQTYNLLIVCGSGVTGCHGELESHRANAVRDGHLILSWQDPAAIAVLITRDRWKYLTADGEYSDDPPGVAA